MAFDSLWSQEVGFCRMNGYHCVLWSSIIYQSQLSKAKTSLSLGQSLSTLRSLNGASQLHHRAQVWISWPWKAFLEIQRVPRAVSVGRDRCDIQGMALEAVFSYGNEWYGLQNVYILMPWAIRQPPCSKNWIEIAEKFSRKLLRYIKRSLEAS